MTVSIMGEKRGGEKTVQIDTENCLPLQALINEGNLWVTAMTNVSEQRATAEIFFSLLEGSYHSK